MAEKHTVAMFIQGEDNRRVQVGWASPADADGVRTFEYSPGFEGTSPRDVSFDDDEHTQEVAQEQALSRRGDGTDGDAFAVEVDPSTAPTDSEELSGDSGPAPVRVQPAVTDVAVDAVDSEKSAGRVEDAPDETEAAQPVDAGVEPEETVEINTGGSITEVADEETEEEELERLIAEEEAAKNKDES